MMNRRGFFFSLTAVTLALAAASCGPPYGYVHIAVPSPLLGARQVSLEPMHFEAMHVGALPEPVYLSRKTPEQQQSFQIDKQEYAQHFAASLQANSPIPVVLGPPPDAATLIVRPIVTHYEPGFYAYVAAQPTQVDLTVQLVSPAGQVIEEIQTRVAVAASMVEPAAGTRFRRAGDVLGEYVATYLRHRVQGIAMAPAHGGERATSF